MKKILIVNSNYYKEISNNLVNKTVKELKLEKFKISIINVAGAFEIPTVIRKNINKYDAFVALGCVIKGQTPHFNFICFSVFNAILKISIDFNKPIGNGIITALNKNQAIKRSIKSNSKKLNKGSEAAKAIISIIKNGIQKI